MPAASTRGRPTRPLTNRLRPFSPTWVSIHPMWQLIPLTLVTLLPVACKDHSTAVGKVGTDRTAAVDAASSLPPASQLVFEQTTRDLGRVALTDSAQLHTASFTVTNHADQQVIFGDMIVGCGCMHATAIPKVLNAGESGRIEVKLKSNQPGEQSVWVLVPTSLRSQPQVELTVLWNAVQPIELSPSSLDFGSVHPDSEVSQTIRMSVSEFANGTSGSVRVMPFQSDNLRATITSEQTLVVDLAAGSDIGAFREVLQLEFEDTSLPAQRIPIQWKVRPLVACEPPSAGVGVVEAGDRITATFTVHNSGPTLWSDDSVRIDSEDGLSSVQLEPLSDHVARVFVTHTAPSSPGAFRIVVPFPVQAPGNHPLQAALTGYVRDSNPGQLDGE